jgi:hypothetical protein
MLGRHVREEWEYWQRRALRVLRRARAKMGVE